MSPTPEATARRSDSLAHALRVVVAPTPRKVACARTTAEAVRAQIGALSARRERHRRAWLNQRLDRKQHTALTEAERAAPSRESRLGDKIRVDVLGGFVGHPFASMAHTTRRRSGCRATPTWPRDQRTPRTALLPSFTLHRLRAYEFGSIPCKRGCLGDGSAEHVFGNPLRGATTCARGSDRQHHQGRADTNAHDPVARVIATVIRRELTGRISPRRSSRACRRAVLAMADDTSPRPSNIFGRDVPRYTNVDWSDARSGRVQNVSRSRRAWPTVSAPATTPCRGHNPGSR